MHTLSACCGSTIRLVLIYSHGKRVREWVFTEAISIQQQEDSARLWFHSFLCAAHWNIDHALWTELLPGPLIPASYSIHSSAIQVLKPAVLNYQHSPSSLYRVLESKGRPSRALNKTKKDTYYINIWELCWMDKQLLMFVHLCDILGENKNMWVSTVQ